MFAFVVALATSICRVPEMTDWLTRSLAIAAAVAAGAALVDQRLHPTWDGRLVGLGQLRNSVVAGFAFNAGLMFAASAVSTGGTAWRAIGIVCVALTATAVCATGSRSAYLSGAIGLWTLLWTWRGSAARPLVWFAVPAGGVALVLATLMLQPTWIETLFPRGDSFRLEIWGAEWQRLIENGPWFGLGVLVPDDVVLQGEVFVHPHSLYLASALQGGLVGLLLLLGVLFYTGLNLYRARRQDGAPLGLALLATGMTAYLLDGWELIDKVSVSWLLLWTPVAIAVGVRSRMQNQHRIPGTGPIQRSIDPIEAQL